VATRVHQQRAPGGLRAAFLGFTAVRAREQSLAERHVVRELLALSLSSWCYSHICREFSR
jgi:hypothetical protein